MHKDRDVEQWNIYERAIKEVEDLVFDDQFINVLHQRSLQETASYTQGAIPLCPQNHRLYRESILSASTAGNYLTLADVKLKIDSEGGFHRCQGYMKVNERDLTLTSVKGTIYVREEDMPLLPIEPVDLTNFLLITATSLMDESEEAEAILRNDSLYVDRDPWDRLRTLISQMGNFTGRSTQTIRSLFLNQTEGIITEYSESETPDDSGYSAKFHLYRANDWFADETNVNHTEQHHSKQTTEVQRLARRAISDVDLNEFVDSAANKFPEKEWRGAIHASYTPESKPEDVRRYATLCLDLLESYKRLTQE